MKMKQSYPNSTECSMAILNEVYEWNDSAEHQNPMNYIKNFLEYYKKGLRYEISNDSFVIKHRFHDNEGDLSVDIKFTYQPNSDFNSFVSYMSTHDGTLMFVYENITKSIHDLLYLRIREFGEKVKSPIEQGDSVEIVFGDITIANANKPEFGTKEKPWRTQRTITIIPTKINIIRATSDELI